MPSLPLRRPTPDSAPRDATSAPRSVGPLGPDADAIGRAWTTAGVAIGLGLAAIVFLFWDAIAVANSVWYNSRTYNHCYMIAPIVAYLIWEKRRWLSRVAPVPYPPAALAALPIGLGWLLAHFGGVYEAQHFAVVAAIQVLFFAVLGPRIYRALLFPLLYLFFLVPSGDFLVPRLQDFTAEFVVAGLRLVGVPVFSDGVFISIPNGEFEVAEACAGIRFLIASVAYGFLFAYVIYGDWKRRVAFVAASFVVPVIANGFRAFGIVMLAHLSDNKLAVDVDHLIYGWFFFSLVTLALSAVGFALRDAGPRDDPSPPAAARGVRPAMAAVAALAAVTVLAAPRAYAEYREAFRPEARLERLAAPAIRAPWTALPVDPQDWPVEFESADRTTMARYAGEGAEARLFVAYYAYQRGAAKATSSQNRVYDGKQWRRIGSAPPAVLEIDGRQVRVAAVRLESWRSKRLVWYWYWIDGHYTASGIEARLRQAKAETVGPERAAAFVAIAADYIESPTEAEAKLRRFAAALGSLSAQLAGPGAP